MFILIQIIGGLGYLLLALSYYKKDKKNILLLQILSYVMFVIHYYLLGGITGSICNLLGLVGFLIIYFFENKTKKLPILIIPIVLGIIIISLFTFKDLYSIFPIFASISVLISFLEKDTHVIRLIGVFSAICWLVYAVYCNSYVAIIFEVLLLLSTFISVLKNNRKK